MAVKVVWGGWVNWILVTMLCILIVFLAITLKNKHINYENNVDKWTNQTFEVNGNEFVIIHVGAGYVDAIGPRGNKVKFRLDYLNSLEEY